MDVKGSTWNHRCQYHDEKMKFKSFNICKAGNLQLYNNIV